ncbi:S-adenosyl-L-methionine-dependent methyltransferase [Schizophyllum amplum]|uniref:S-adenosyl-L-methionine-dependent methyltransferase n=1 Tax=Schizophyllum amplum TaxID=97359 RepID=A0A550BYA6_9AGAR|nr:S-adenosyl-L-methionine-dependent methyltransferase [Auriculariopsis ampla]
MNNQNMFKYYKAQKLFGEDLDAEWDSLVEAFRKPLPTTFRVTGNRSTALTLNNTIVENYVPHLQNVVFEDKEIPPPEQIPWFPEGLAWQVNVPKKVLRKQEEFRKFHAFLVGETEVGNISRQEAVSMLPPLFLDVKPWHRVIDLCAAPGSKTAQLLEMLHSAPDPTAEDDLLPLPSGLLLANDSDAKRTHLLIHQSARLPSPALMVTNLDASRYPGIRVPAWTLLKGEQEGQKDERLRMLTFDRILGDVPCSGDGTLRKNLGIWKTWTVADGNGLHSLQLRILARAMQMLSPESGSRIVYSTCSLNPMENEAVIAEALAANRDFELVDASSHLPALKRRPGLTTWICGENIPTGQGKGVRELRLFKTWEEYKAHVGPGQNDPAAESLAPAGEAPAPVIGLATTEGASDTPLAESETPSITAVKPPRFKQTLTPGHFPPTENFHLERCMRIYPHLQDTGGFFVAVLERKAGAAAGIPETDFDMEDMAEDAVEEAQAGDQSTLISTAQASEMTGAKRPASTEPDDEAKGAKRLKVDDAAPATTTDSKPASSTARPLKKQKTLKDDPTYKESPYTFLREDDPTLSACLANLKLLPTFPRGNVLIRAPLPPPDLEASDKPTIRTMYLANDLAREVILHNDHRRLRLMNGGTKVFERQGGNYVSKDDIQFRILGEGLPVVISYVDPTIIMQGNLAVLKSLLLSYFPRCDQFQDAFRKAIESRTTGSHVMRIPPEEWEGINLTHELILPLWKSEVSVSLMVDKKAKSAMSLRLFHADITPAKKDPKAKQDVAQSTDKSQVQEEDSSMLVAEPEQGAAQ